jgi:hypothetical protein
MTDIGPLRKIMEAVEAKLSKRQDDLTQAASILAATVGPLAAAHRLAELAIEMHDLAKDREGKSQ